MPLHRPLRPFPPRAGLVEVFHLYEKTMFVSAGHGDHADDFAYGLDIVSDYH